MVRFIMPKSDRAVCFRVSKLHQAFVDNIQAQRLGPVLFLCHFSNVGLRERHLCVQSCSLDPEGSVENSALPLSNAVPLLNLVLQLLAQQEARH